MLRKLVVGLASAWLVFMPLTAQALGFGNIKLNSALNEPLDAQIELLSPTSADIQSLKVQLASEGAFARAGIDRPHFLSSLKFEVIDRNGNHFIQVTSSKSIREPFINFLVEFDWDNGRMLREYTMLLDPPGRMMHEPAPAMAETPATEAPADTISRYEPAPYEPAPQATPAPAMETAPRVSEPAEQKAPAAQDTVAVTAGAEPTAPEETVQDVAAPQPVMQEPAYANAGEGPFVDDGSMFPRIDIGDYRASTRDSVELGELDYGVTKKGDNAWTIAQKLQRDADSASIYQIMMALLQSNPDAFVDGNIHRLKTGQVLRIEDPSLLNAMSRKQAANEYIAQTESWNQYRQTVAERTGRQAVVADAGSQQQPVQAETGGELTLSSPDGKDLQAGAGASEDAMSNDLITLQDELRQVRENASSVHERNVELNRQLQEMEEELARLQRSVSIKDDELAALQKQLAELNAQTRAAAGTAGEQPAAEPTAPAAEEPVTARTEADEAEEPAGSREEPAAEKPAAEEQPRAAVEPEAGPKGMVEEYLAMARDIFNSAVEVVSGMISSSGTNSLLMYVAAPVLLVLVILMLIVVRRRRQAEGNYQESILSGGPSTVTNSGEAASAGESSFLSDFAVSGAGAIQTEDSEVDPLTEADVFMAYGRYEAAEERLREAIEKDPGRKELKLKLLELYSATQNSSAFEGLAEEYYASLGSNADTDPQWQKVVGMGKTLAPNNPLFAAGAAAAATAPTAASEEPGVGFSDSQVMDIGLDTGVFESGDFAGGGQEASPASDLDFNLDFDSESQTGGGVEQTGAGGMDFNLDTGGSEAEEPQTQNDLPDLDFNLGGGAEESTGELDMALGGETEETRNDLEFNLDMNAEPASAGDDSGLSLDLGGETAQPDQSADEGLEFNLGGEDTMALDTGGLDFAGSEPAGMDLDLGGTDSGESDMPLGGGDEVGTKLDLARAYIDMGDPDGARSILDEVLSEGSDSQKHEAEQLLQQIA